MFTPSHLSPFLRHAEQLPDLPLPPPSPPPPTHSLRSLVIVTCSWGHDHHNWTDPVFGLSPSPSNRLSAWPVPCSTLGLAGSMLHSRPGRFHVPLSACPVPCSTLSVRSHVPLSVSRPMSHSQCSVQCPTLSVRSHVPLSVSRPISHSHNCHPCGTAGRATEGWAGGRLCGRSAEHL